MFHFNSLRLCSFSLTDFWGICDCTYRVLLQTYFENYGEVPFGDITKPETKALIPQKFDVLCAGFPCQPFSYSGQKLGFKDKTKGTLFFDVCEILKERQPQAFFLENVKGIVSHENGKTIETIRSILTDELGYDIHEGVLCSLDFGLPQKRERWYCVGFKKKTEFQFPVGTHKGATLRDIIDLNNDDPSLVLPKFELDRIKYHFEHADEIRVKHDNSKYAPNTKKGKYGVYSFQKPDGSLRFHVGDPAKTQIQEAFYRRVSYPEQMWYILRFKLKEVMGMPRKPKHPCRHPGCPKLTENRFCEEHTKEYNRNYEKYDRDPAVRRRYGRAWNQIWYQIFQVVKENCSVEFSGPTPQDDVMERLLRSRKGV